MSVCHGRGLVATLGFQDVAHIIVLIDRNTVRGLRVSIFRERW